MYPLDKQKEYPLPGWKPLGGDLEVSQFRSLDDETAQQGSQTGAEAKGQILPRSLEESTHSVTFANRKL